MSDMGEYHESILFIIMSIERLLLMNSKQFIANIKSTYCLLRKQIEALTIRPERKHFSASEKKIRNELSQIKQFKQFKRCTRSALDKLKRLQWNVGSIGFRCLRLYSIHIVKSTTRWMNQMEKYIVGVACEFSTVVTNEKHNLLHFSN